MTGTLADRQATALLVFGAGARVPDGFGWLDARGRLTHDEPTHTWITARMTYVFALGTLLDHEGSRDLTEHGVAALRGALRDDRHGGWFPTTADRGEKRAYDTAFVLLAASAAVVAGIGAARELRDEAAQVLVGKFWDADEGLSRDLFTPDWSRADDYRGANANMHLVEAFLAAGDVTGDPRWHRRALGIADRLINGVARDFGWRLPEHFDTRWRPLPGYHADRPADPFRPPGATIGHGLEWARLLVHLHLALPDPPSWLLPAASDFYAASVRDGWARDGAPGFLYTVDFDGRPLVRRRMHWVVAEAIGAAALVPGAADDLPRWWDYARQFLIDDEFGGWHHELDPANRPDPQTWDGKPDVYHAFQAALLTVSAPSSSLITALRPTAESRTA